MENSNGCVGKSDQKMFSGGLKFKGDPECTKESKKHVLG